MALERPTVTTVMTVPKGAEIQKMAALALLLLEAPPSSGTTFSYSIAAGARFPGAVFPVRYSSLCCPDCIV